MMLILRGLQVPTKRQMFLVDTNVISEARKKGRAHPGVTRFFDDSRAAAHPLYLSSISVGELRRGVDLNRHRGDLQQADLLEAWLATILTEFRDRVLDFDAEAAQLWGRLRVPDPGHALNKQIAAIALINDLTVVSRNLVDFQGMAVRVKNPFEPEQR